MTFVIDKRLTTSSTPILELKLSSLFLKDDATYPWLILIPRVENTSEVYQLDQAQQAVLIEEINITSLILKKCFSPHKINIGALGNIVEQLHIHVVGRFREDPTWPQSIWQANQTIRPYDLKTKEENINKLKQAYHSLISTVSIQW